MPRTKSKDSVQRSNVASAGTITEVVGIAISSKRTMLRHSPAKLLFVCRIVDVEPACHEYIRQTRANIEVS